MLVVIKVKWCCVYGVVWRRVKGEVDRDDEIATDDDPTQIRMKETAPMMKMVVVMMISISRIDQLTGSLLGTRHC